MTLNNQNIIKPSKAVIELASHSLPILKRRLKELIAEKEQLENDIEYYEGILQDTVISISDFKSLQKGFTTALERDSILKEYFYCTSYTDKILLITEFPNKFGKQLIEGSTDILSIISEIEELHRGAKLDRIKQTVQSTISRLYDKALLFKYRYIGTKGKYVTIHSKWLENGKFKEQYKSVTGNIEPAISSEDEESTLI
jgi:hypothetical protein